MLAALAALVALAVLVPGLGDHGIWSDGELPVFDRSRAELGTALTGLIRSPWLPDWLRTRSYDAVGGVAGLRLPHALSGVGLVALTVGVARWRGASVTISLLAGALALSMPGLGLASRTALGNPVGELAIALAIVSGVAGLEQASWRRAGPLLLLASLAGAASLASAGLATGGALPLSVLAGFALTRQRAEPQAVGEHRAVALALSLAAVTAIAVTIMLSMRQGEGYIPILGAAKDLELIDKPQGRRFVAGLGDAGYQLFPWAPLALLGAATGRRDPLPSLWLAASVTTAVAWSVIYGPVTIPAVVPAALCAAAAVDHVTRPQTPAAWRRLALVLGIGGLLVLGKDAKRTPSRVAAPLVEFRLEQDFPEEKVEAAEPLGRTRNLAALSLLLAGLLVPGRSRLGRLVARVPQRYRDPAGPAVVGAVALLAGVTYARGVVDDLSRALSPRAVLDAHARWAEAGALPSTLGTHRLRDPGLAIYGPTSMESLPSRRDAIDWLAADEPRALLVRRRDVAPLHLAHRQQGFDFFVLDDGHAQLVLLSNVLPEDAEDHNQIPTVLFDEPPALANETYLRFENYVEIVGWQVTDPIVRGRKVVIELSIRVLRPLPGGSKIYTRFLKGKSSRMNGDPQALTNDIYPPNLWREGDYILHRFEFEAPLVEIQPAPHEFFVGLRRSEQKNYDISAPEPGQSEFGVRIRGKKPPHEFATIGIVDVW